MFLSCLAAAFTFTATATGLEKGATAEFLFIGADSDRAYEAMFTLDMPLADFAKAIEKAGLKPGKPVDASTCSVWPVGTPVAFTPEITDFVSIDGADGFSLGRIVYTGGTRDARNVPAAATEMPSSLCSFFSLGQSLFVPEGMIDQGEAYGKFHAAATLKKGAKFAFTVSWNDADTPKHIDLHADSTNVVEMLKKLKEASLSSSLDVLVSFDGDMTVAEATNLAKALDLVDSVRVKITGVRQGSLFFRAFLPLVKWKERQNRMLQPFELTIASDSDELVFIDEDWTVEGDDPKLTPRKISFEEALSKDKTDTCFIFARPETRLSRIYEAMSKLKGSKVRNWYIFARQD